VNVTAESISFSVVDVMQTDVYSLSPETSVGDARGVVAGNRVNHLLVIENGMLAGILSQEDLSWADQSAPVRDCMTSPVPCVGPETTVDDAAEIMSEQRLSCLAVVIDALLVGIISRTELAGMGFVLEPYADSAQEGRCVSCGGDETVIPRALVYDVLLCQKCACRVHFRVVQKLAAA
jgi:CBS domain-containing protein